MEPAKLRDAGGVVKWHQQAGVPEGYVSGLHFNGVAYNTANLGNGSFFAADTSGGITPSIDLESGTFVGELVAIPNVNTVLALTSDLTTAKTFTAGTPGSVPLSGQVASNFVVIDGDTLVYLRQDGSLTGLTFTGPNTSTVALPLPLSVSQGDTRTCRRWAAAHF